MSTCTRCGKNEALPFQDGEERLCGECLDALAYQPTTCPVCSTKVPAEEAVALLLTRATATEADRLAAATALVNVCPKCHVLYFDDVQYGALCALRQKV